MDATRLGPSLSNATVSLINCSRSAADENAYSREVLTKSSILSRAGHAAKHERGDRSLFSYRGKAVEALEGILGAGEAFADLWPRAVNARLGSRQTPRVKERRFLRSGEAESAKMRACVLGNACEPPRIARRGVSFSTGLLCDWIHAPKQKLSKRKRAAIEVKAFQRGRVDAVRHAVAQIQVP